MDLFLLLANRKEHLTVRDLRKWVYIKEPLVDGPLKEFQLVNLLRSVGAHRDKLDIDQFHDFVSAFTALMHFKESSAAHRDETHSVNGSKKDGRSSISQS